jgi:hypothetical protein
MIPGLTVRAMLQGRKFHLNSKLESKAWKKNLKAKLESKS